MKVKIEDASKKIAMLMVELGYLHPVDAKKIEKSKQLQAILERLVRK